MPMRISCVNNGFSLVEVVTAGVIFSIAVAGVFASLANIQQQTSNITDKGFGAALCAQDFLESLRASVDQRDWSSGRLALTAGSPASDCVQTVHLANGTDVPTTYHLAYSIVDGGSGASSGLSRKATVTVTW